MASDYPLAIAIAIAAVRPTAALAMLVAALGYVGQQGQFAGTLDSARDLALMPAARAGDPARANLASFGDEAAKRRDVLVVDLVDLVAAVRAGLPASGRGPTFPVAPANRPSTLLRHLASPNQVRSAFAA